MPTPKQKKAFKNTIENIATKNPQPVGELLIDSGYSPSIAKKPSMVIESKGFKELLATIDDNKIVEQFYKYALDKSDKRVSMEAGKEILKLKNRYPDQKSKLVGLFGSIQD